MPSRLQQALNLVGIDGLPVSKAPPALSRAADSQLACSARVTSGATWPRFAWGTPAREGDAAGISDESLFERTCRGDDHAAFSQLVTRYRLRVNALVRRMLTSAQTAIDPEDVAQEAFLDAYRRRATFRRGSLFRPWLYGIAVNRCVDRMRMLDREATVEILEGDDDSESIHSAGAPDPVDILMRAQELRAIDRAVGFLPPKLRAVLVLRYVDDLSYEEIATACELPLGTVKTHLFRARAELKRRLDDEQK